MDQITQTLASLRQLRMSMKKSAYQTPPQDPNAAPQGDPSQGGGAPPQPTPEEMQQLQAAAEQGDPQAQQILAQLQGGQPPAGDPAAQGAPPADPAAQGAPPAPGMGAQDMAALMQTLNNVAGIVEQMQAQQQQLMQKMQEHEQAFAQITAQVGQMEKAFNSQEPPAPAQPAMAPQQDPAMAQQAMMGQAEPKMAAVAPPPAATPPKAAPAVTLAERFKKLMTPDPSKPRPTFNEALAKQMTGAPIGL